MSNFIIVGFTFMIQLLFAGHHKYNRRTRK